MAVLASLLVASEASIRSLIDDWFETCTIVVESGTLVSENNENFVPIKLFILGTPPEVASLVVYAEEPLFTKLEYHHSLTSVNRALHPDPPKTVASMIQPAGKNIPMDISPLRENLLYSFRAHIADGKANFVRINKDVVGVFIQFSKDETGNLCRVERATLLNSLVGRTPWTRFWFLLSIVILLTVTITMLRSKQRETRS